MLFHLIALTCLVFTTHLQSACDSECDTFLTCVLRPDQRNYVCTKDYGKTFFSIRPQDSNSAQRLIEIAREKGHSYYRTQNIGWGFNVSIGGQKTFSDTAHELGAWFLFNDTNCISVGTPTSTTQFTVDALQLGLISSSTTVNAMGNLSIRPHTSSIISNITGWLDLNNIAHGLWMRGNVAIVKNSRSLHLQSNTQNVQTSGNYPSGFYTTHCDSTPIAYTSIDQAFIGDKAIGEIPALYYGKFYCDSLKHTGIASFRCDIGADVIKQQNGFLNLSGCLIIPTGNRPNAHHLFEPIIGTNKSWQLGAVLSGAYQWHKQWRFLADVTLSHLFKSKQTRIFGFKHNGAGSQYLLLKEIYEDIGVTFAGERAANVLAGDCKIGAALMMDASIMLECMHKNFFADLGYNFWLRTHEQLSDKICLRNFAHNIYGIKGDTPLSHTDSISSFCIGDVSTESTSTLGQPGAIDATTVFISACDIDFTTPLHPLAFSNKLFGAIGYLHECENKEQSVYISLEAEAEFGQKRKALNQWALAINFGITR